MIEKYDLIPLDTRSSVVNYYANAVDVLNITGFYNISKENNEYQRIKNDLANLIANSYEKKANKDFHNSLNFFQKNGYFVNSIYNDHVKKVGFTKGTIELFTRTSMDIAPLIYDSYLLKRKNNKIADFITGWLGYINRSNSMLISYRVKEQFIKLNKKFNSQRFEEEFYKFADDLASDFPVIKDISIYEKNRLHDFIISLCDLSKPDVFDRAQNFCNIFLNIPYTNAKQRIYEINENQEYVSDLTSVTGICINDLFSDLINNINISKQYAYYSIENDSFASIRNERKQIIDKSIKEATPIGLASLTFFTGPVGDALLTLAAPSINKFLNTEMDFNKNIEIRRRIENIKKGETLNER